MLSPTYPSGGLGLDAAGLKSLLINGQEIKGQVDLESIAPRAEYSLVLVCR